MKIIVQIARILTALLFIFSGVIKLNDPSGFSIKLNEYFDVFAQDVSTVQDTLKISLSDGTKVLGSKSYVINHFDTERELAISSAIDTTQDVTKILTIGKRKDSIWKEVVKINYELTFTATLAGQSAIETEMDLPDSLTVAMFALKATVGSKGLFQKDYKVSVASPVNAKTSINLRDHVKMESGLNGFFKWLKKYSLFLSIFVCALEVILGFALIVGWSIRFTTWMLLLLILFFTFLTFYAAFFNKVTDCGCFGDFLHLKPWQSFNKDLILLVFILIIFFGKKFIKPWFSKSFGWKFMTFITLISSGFGVFCYLYLSIWDFLPYKEGNDIKKIMTDVPVGMRASDSITLSFVLHKGMDSVEVPFSAPYKEYSEKIKAGWKADANSRRQKVVIEGYKNPIHDFVITDTKAGIEYKDTFLNNANYQLMWVVPYIDNAYQGCTPEIKEISEWSKSKRFRFWALCSSGPDLIDAWVKQNKAGFQFYESDQKTLLSIARYAPTLYLFKGPISLRKWSGRNLPSLKKLEKLTSK